MIKHAVPIVAVLSLGVLPAHSNNNDDLTAIQIHTLTLIDQLPTRGQILASTIDPVDPVPRLATLALDGNVDFGVRLRATRALPQFCAGSVPSCKDDTDANMHPIRAAVRDVITTTGAQVPTGKSLLQLRAGIEALGAIQSGKQSDVDLLVPFLANPARDIRFATARALRELCIPTAEAPLRNRYEDEPVAQVRLAISAALGDLAQCSQ